MKVLPVGFCLHRHGWFSNFSSGVRLHESPPPPLPLSRMELSAEPPPPPHDGRTVLLGVAARVPERERVPGLLADLVRVPLPVLARVWVGVPVA